MADNLLYVNARIKALENGLMSQLHVSRLIDAENVKDAFKILQECGFSEGVAIDDYRSYENLVALKEKNVVDFFKENMLEKTGMDAVLLKNDYHNAKVLIKAKYLRLDDVKDMLMPAGLFDTDKMKADIFDDNYESYPSFMAEALDAIDVQFADGNRSPRFIDVTLDKAMFSDMYARISKCNQQALKDWLNLLIDTANVSAFLRCRKLHLDKSVFDEGFVEKGSIGKDWFDELYESSDDVVKDKAKLLISVGDLIDVALSDADGMVRFETAVDNKITKLFKDNKYDMFSVAPIVGYYFGRLTEIKAVKLIVSAVKNNLDKNLLRQRTRDLYA